MNIYKPYEAIVDTRDMLHLKETEARERMQFVFSRVIPIALLLSLWFIIQQIGSQMPMSIIYLLVAVTFGLVLLLFFRRYVTEIKITPAEIFMVQKTVNGTKDVTVPVAGIERISLQVRKGKGGGAKYLLHMKNKKRWLLLRIPLPWMNDKNLIIISTVIEQLIHLPVENN